MTEIKTVCIVDDDIIFVEITKRVLQKSGFFNDLLIYENGDSALNGLNKIIGNGGHLPKIILLDLNMPLMNGWEFLDQLSKVLYKNKISVFVASSSNDPNDINRAKSYQSVVDYIVKPICNDDVIRIIKTYNDQTQ